MYIRFHKNQIKIVVNVDRQRGQTDGWMAGELTTGHPDSSAASEGLRHVFRGSPNYNH